MKKRLSFKTCANSNTASEQEARRGKIRQRSDNLPKETSSVAACSQLGLRLFGWKPIFDQPSWNGWDKWELQLTAGPVIAISSSGFSREVNSSLTPDPTPPSHLGHSVHFVFFTSTATTPLLIPLTCHFRLEISITLILPVCGLLTRKSLVNYHHALPAGQVTGGIKVALEPFSHQ